MEGEVFVALWASQGDFEPSRATLSPLGRLFRPSRPVAWSLIIQSNLDGLNTDNSFTMANSNSFLSPYEILLIAQENKYLMIFSYFIVKLYVVCTH